MSMSASTQIPFRRMTNPLVLPVGPTAQRFDVPTNFFTSMAGITSFYVVNANNFWVRLKGSPMSTTPYSDITETQGWLFSPGFQGAFTTQFPVWMSTLAVNRQGLTPGTGVLELCYGRGQ
jgi:hypothetical protein